MKHSELAIKFYKEKGPRHDKALWTIRQKRDKAIKEVKKWEELREKASKIKDEVIENLKAYVDEFMKNAKKEGIEIYFAKDGNEHNEIVYKLLKEIDAKKIVKSKSMLTEECGLNEFLEKKGIEVIDTDLGERIVQLRKEFLSADAGISGANFLIANKGWAVVCTNEGNADLGAVLPKLHIISVGVEKILPSLKDLGIFLRMLTRNATGQKITTYTSIFGKKDNGKRVIILVDNGRFDRLSTKFKETLKCIRCSACLTTCPVFRRSGGHSYRYIIPGPIGSLLAPLKDKQEYSDLPFACTLCGSCEMVCPVKIPFSKQLRQMRKYVTMENVQWKMENEIVKISEKAMHSPTMFKIFSKIIRLTPKPLLEKVMKEWSRYKAMPIIPKERFIK